MNQFRPTIEVLDARTLPSAVIAEHALAAPPADHPGDHATAGKVTFQDLHFTKDSFPDLNFAKTDKDKMEPYRHLEGKDKFEPYLQFAGKDKFHDYLG